MKLKLVAPAILLCGALLTWQLQSANAATTSAQAEWKLVDGKFPLSWDWRQSHDLGTGSVKTEVSSGKATLQKHWIHNIEDGWKPREATAFSNTGVMDVHDVLMTGIRDDSIENDHFMPGTISNSLFDGVWTFLSEQNQSEFLGSTIGPNESKTISIDRAYVRLYTTNANEVGPGRFFKWQSRGVTNHNLVIKDSVFAIDKMPRSGWKNTEFPAGTQFQGSNFLLWLGTPGSFEGQRPAGVTFLEGPAALQKWNDVRNSWYTAHGFPAKAINDLNPMAWKPVQPGVASSITTTTKPGSTTTVKPSTTTTTVLNGPVSITLQPEAGKLAATVGDGDEIKVTGRDYPANTAIQLTAVIDDGSALSAVTTDSSGSFKASFQAPPNFEGKVIIQSLVKDSVVATTVRIS